MKVLIAGGGTGGHLMPALAIANALRSARDDVEPVLVGAERGVEARLLPERGTVRYHLLPAEPIYRRTWWRNWRLPWVAIRVVRAARRILDAERPAFVVATGGYAAGPIAWLASRRGIPLAMQEQNAWPGLTSRWLAPRCAQIHLGFPEARARLRIKPGTKVLTLGNPVPPPPVPRPDPADAKRALGLDPTRPACFVMGGSQGAVAINRAIGEIIDRGAWPDVSLLWSTGSTSWSTFSRYHDPPHRIVRSFWDPIADAYAAADLAVTRAGAMTLADLTAWGLPAILIPLPSAAADHQTANAIALQEAGCAVHLPQSRLTGESCLEAVQGLLRSDERLEEMRVRSLERGRPDASARIAEALLTLARSG